MMRDLSMSVPVSATSVACGWFPPTWIVSAGVHLRRIVTMWLAVHFARRPIMENPSTAQLESGTVTKTATEARQGTTPGIVRWVLGVSTFGAIVALVAAYLLVRGP
jgi:hypothetical protein